MKKVTYFLLSLLAFLKAQPQVNLQTGSAVFSLPMFDWQDDKSRLHFNMSLNYNSGNGLKVNEVASNVGQGWNLMSGGIITRMLVGEPDDQYPNEGNGTIEDINKYPAGYLFNPYDVSIKGCPTALARYPIFSDKDHIYRQNNEVGMDRELDYFTYNFNGKNGVFVLNKYDNTGYELGDSKVQIHFNLSNSDLKFIGDNKTIRTRISDFWIQDEDGLIYKFGKYQNQSSLPVYGITKILKVAYCDINGVQSLTQPNFKGGHVYYQSLFVDTKITNPYIINSWYLTEIDDPFTNQQVLFVYGQNITTPVVDPVQTSITYYKEKDYSVISRKATQSFVPYLTNIQFPDQHLITFTYGAQRLDVKNEQVLSSVDINYNGRALSKYELKTSYFIFNRYGIPTDFEKSASRLCLLSVKKYGVDLSASNNPYIFDYNLGSDNSTTSDDIVPPYSFPLKDIWGYYNGTNSTAYDGNAIISGKPVSELNIFDYNNNNDCKGLCFLKSGSSNTVLNSKSGYADNGLLRQIIYPTGGTLTYTYAQNKGIFIGATSSGNIGGVHVSKTSSTDGGYSNGCDNPIIIQYNYLLDDETSSSLWGAERPVNTSGNPINNHYAPELRHHTFSIHNIPFGTCNYTYQYPGIMYEEEKTSTKWTQAALAVLSDVLDVVSTLMEIREIVTVVNCGSPVSLILDVIFGIADLLISCLSNPHQDFTSTTYYDLDLNGINPLPMQYSRVEIVPNTGDIGKTVETFTSQDDYAFWPSTNPNFIMQQRYGLWEYGAPKLVTTFDKDGTKIKEIQYDYDPNTAILKHQFTCPSIQSEAVSNATPPPTCVPLASCNCEVTTNRSQRFTDWSDVSNINYGVTSDISKHIYYYYSGRLNLSDVTERMYKPGSSTTYLQTKTHYDYDTYDTYLHPGNALNVWKTTVTQSNGDETYTYVKYSGDFDNGVYAMALKPNNSLSIPVETVSSIKKLNGTEQFLSDKTTELIQLTSNQNIVPSKILEQRFNSPQSSIIWYNPGGANSQFVTTQTFNYDANGKITGIKDEGSHSVTNIYDYPDAHNYSYKYITASIINADPNADKPAYTSFENTSVLNTYFGGWIITGAVTSSSYIASSITGNQSLKLSGLSLKASGLNTSKSYKLSFWANTSGTGIATTGGNATLSFSGPSYNGFTYYEYNIAAGASIVTITGTTTIDELRLYPSNARMRTTTYDPLIGKTSECDENNRITYYEYDALSRLKLVKDENKNIVKMYEYNVITNQNGCPGTYSNHLITETFIKSNCAAGYQGNPVTYSVAAGQFTSSISQADADQKAQNYLNTNGQTNADNNGTCALIYYNNGLTKTFYTQGCPVTQYGAAVPYTVPPKRYSSILGQDVVNQMEQDDMDANGQAYANNDGRNCINNPDPYWEATEPESTRCQKDGNQSYTGHIEVWMTDVNTSSSSHGAKAWQDGGADETTCPHDEGTFPSLSSGQTNATGHGVRIYPAGTVVHVTVTLNGYNSLSSSLTGTISGGGSVSLSGRGTTTQQFTVTVPAEGYISWYLALSGPSDNSGLISSYINFN